MNPEAGTPRECLSIGHGSSHYEACVALRTKVLRAPLGLRFFDGELARESEDFHLALLESGEVAACLVLVPQAAKTIKMRQVAVEPSRQGGGLGRTLVAFAEEFARERGFESMVLHARETAVAFYERLGYERVGESFIEVTIAHWVMAKRL